MLKLDGSCGVRETGCRVRGTGCGQVTPSATKGHCHPPQKVLQAHRGRMNFFIFSRDAGKKKNVLASWEASLKCGGSCGVRERPMASLPSSASRRSQQSPRQGHLRPPHKGTVLMLRIVQFVNRARPSNKWPAVRQRVYFSCCTNCHVRDLFVNGRRLASNGHVHEWDIVAARFLR